MNFKHCFYVGNKEEMWKNGAVVYINHLVHTLNAMGYDARLVDSQDLQAGVDCDLFWFQSEWFNRISDDLSKLKSSTKTICFFGHFVEGEYKFPNPHSIVADYFVSMWKGPLIDSFNKNVIYFPHGYCTACHPSDIDSGQAFHNKRVIWTGNTHSMRSEGVFGKVKDLITPISNVSPNDLDKIYKTAKASINLHGDAQKGSITDLTPLEAYAFNERFFHIMGAGGFQICDDHPLLSDYNFKIPTYTPDTIVDVLSNVESLRNNKDVFDNQQEVLRNHTYTHRLKELLKQL